MQSKKFTLIGKALTASELDTFPLEAQVSLSHPSKAVVTSPLDLLHEDAIQKLDRLSLLMLTSITLQCPVGPHDDPGLSVAVLRACNISKVGSVAVQCSQGHWAEYPCGG
jgi:hypothetical protein